MSASGASPPPFVWAAPSCLNLERVPVLLATSLGLFEAAGLANPSYRVMGSGAATLEAVESGEASVGEVGLFNIITDLAAREASSPEAGGKECKVPSYRIVGTPFLQQLQYYLASRPAALPGEGDDDEHEQHKEEATGRRLRSVLTGKTCGILSDMSCDATLIPALCARYGINSVKAVPLHTIGATWGDADVFTKPPHNDKGSKGSGDGRGAQEQTKTTQRGVGGLAAVTMSDPALTLAESQGSARVLCSFADVFPGVQWNGFVASRTLLEEEEEEEQEQEEGGKEGAASGKALLRRYLDVYATAVGLMLDVLLGEDAGQLQGAASSSSSSSSSSSPSSSSSSSSSSSVRAALGALARHPFWKGGFDGLGPDAFVRALGRDAALWQRDWRRFDRPGMVKMASVSLGRRDVDGGGGDPAAATETSSGGGDDDDDDELLRYKEMIYERLGALVDERFVIADGDRA